MLQALLGLQTPGSYTSDWILWRRFRWRSVRRIRLSIQYSLWSDGSGSNTWAEVLALWGALPCALWFAVDERVIAGDSKVTINWAKRRLSLSAPSLWHWLGQISSVKDSFLSVSFRHIFKEQYMLADHLSKRGLSAQPGRFHFECWDSCSSIGSGYFLFSWVCPVSLLGGGWSLFCLAFSVSR